MLVANIDVFTHPGIAALATPLYAARKEGIKSYF
jgi:hypothetical protein